MGVPDGTQGLEVVTRSGPTLHLVSSGWIEGAQVSVQTLCGRNVEGIVSSDSRAKDCKSCKKAAART